MRPNVIYVLNHSVESFTKEGQGDLNVCVFCLRGKIVHVSLIAGFRNSSNIDLRKFKCRLFFFSFSIRLIKKEPIF